MNILAIGDIVSDNGCNFLRKKLPAIKREYKIDLTIANAENSAVGNGISRQSMNYVFSSGVDVITTGNHCFKCHDAYEAFDEEEYLLRPANYPEYVSGHGYCIVDKLKYRVCVINLLGVTFMQSMDCPFKTLDKILNSVKSKAEIIVVDFHAEATSEKSALAYYVDGRVSAVFGTHTHVQTADERILPNKTGFITDLGMTGPTNSVLGIKPKIIIKNLKDKLPCRFETAEGNSQMDCAVFNIDESNGNCKSIKRLKIL